MKKTLDILSLLLKVLTASLGGLAATDVTTLHLTTQGLGTVVGALATASIVVKALQSNLPNDAAK